jgi:hypothetical protein
MSFEGACKAVDVQVARTRAAAALGDREAVSALRKRLADGVKQLRPEWLAKHREVREELARLSKLANKVFVANLPAAGGERATRCASDGVASVPRAMSVPSEARSASV